MIRFLLGALLCLTAIDIAGIRVLRQGETFVRFEAVSPTQFNQLGIHESLTPLTDTAFFQTVVPDSVRELPALLRWTMSQTDSVSSPGVVPSARRAYEIANAGGGLVCGQLANMFEHTLAVRGFKTRRISPVRSLLGGDTHVTTEVLIDGRWVIYDPTFNVSFSKNGALLGALEIRQSLLDGTADEIEPVFYGDVPYPARLETYYVHWLPLYNNVLLFSAGEPGLLSRVPPFRFWSGPRWYYVAAEHEAPQWHGRVVDPFYFLFVVVLPLSAMATGLGVAVLVVIRAWTRRSHVPSPG